MVITGLVFLIWAIWPVATFAGGNLLAVLLAATGLATGVWLARNRPGFSPVILPFGLFLIWVCASANWSLVDAPLVSGSLASGDFAVKATALRFPLTVLAGGAFIAWAFHSGHFVAVRPLLLLVVGVVALQGAALLVMSVYRGALLDGTAPDFLPSAQSFGRNANLFGLAVPVAIGAALTLWPERRGRMIGIGFGVAVLLVAIRHDALSLMAGMGLAGLSFAWLTLASRSGLRDLFAGVGASVMVMPILATSLAYLPASFVDSLPLSARHRLLIWQATIERIGERPLLGHGLDATRSWTETYSTRPEWIVDMPEMFSGMPLVPTHPHNMVLHVWVEQGVIGAALLAAACVAIGRLMPATDRLSTPMRLAIAGVFGVAAAQIVLSYSAWDEIFWSGAAIVIASLLLLQRFQSDPA
ncbi:MAG: O-antigen ligase family protein [Pseudomonadota bacterium]